MSATTQHFFRRNTRPGSPDSPPARLWIDLDNSPHVPFFAPLIKALEARKLRVCLTAREAYQVEDLLALHHLACPLIGRHYGQNRVMKLAGLLIRSVQLMQVARRLKPTLAVSHGSRAQMLAARWLGIPSVVIEDYEHVVHLTHPDVLIRPDRLTGNRHIGSRTRVLGYPGMKEYVYIEDFEPDTGFLSRFGITAAEIVVTLRPPASEAHYHAAAGDHLFEGAVDTLLAQEGVRSFILPRNDRQETRIRQRWPEAIATGHILIPTGVVPGLDLLWHSDLVIGGGGTMNREAAALGVPVISLFQGPSGALDRYLIETGKLALVTRPEQLTCLTHLKKRTRLVLDKTGLHQTRERLVNLLEGLSRGVPVS
jgi:predicted glycosyltransferase